MRFFVDECLSPSTARRLNEGGVHEAVHPLDSGGRGASDTAVLARCIDEDRIIVTETPAIFARWLRAKRSTRD